MPVVLVLEDDPAVADATALLLDISGYSTVLASCAEEALDGLEKLGRAPDLLLCDYRLRKSADGLDAIRQIRSMTSDQVPAILLTADTSRAIGAAVERVDRCRRLCKPIDADKLLALMEQLLDGP